MSLTLHILLGLIVDKEWIYTVAFLQGFGDADGLKAKSGKLGGYGPGHEPTPFGYFKEKVI